MSATLARAADPPLDPDGGEGRSLLRDELSDPVYYSDDLIDRALRWVQRWLDTLVDTATRADGLSAFVAVVVVMALIAALLLLAGRARRTTRLQPSDRPALPDERVSAATLRERAEAALAEQRHDEALVDGFRALAVRQIEQHRIADLPQATAHELARALADELTSHAAAIADLADTFDAVLYGDRAASAEQARTALWLDDQLAAVR